MENWLKNLKTRRSVSARLLKGEGPSPAQIEEILTIASRVPDHGKLAPWRFILVQGVARSALGSALAGLLQSRGETSQEKLDLEYARFTRAPLVVIVVSCAQEHIKIPLWEQFLSAGAVCMNLIWAATAHGFACNWLTEWMAYDADARSICGLEPHEQVAGFIYVGHSNETPADRDRPKLHDIVKNWQI
jgi:nitroreductase